MIVRKVTIEDYDAIYQLWISCAGMGLNNLDDSKEGIQKFLDRNPETCFVAVQDDIDGVILAGHDGRRGHIYHTAVRPRCRHQGIGSKLVLAAIEALAEQGINKVSLVVFEDNQVGNAFWEKQGFTVRDDLIYRNRTINLQMKTL
ncbi:MAG: GNAT family N-acetyltransferase [Bacillota bacterium]|nr:GNAT family N-acetyltransferase [Bacillota bacterium]